MKKREIFRIHAIVKTLINQVVIDIEGCDKHENEAFVKSFNLTCPKTNFRKFSILRSFKIFLKFEFFKNLHFQNFKKNHQNCSISWPHIWKVSFWDLNGILVLFFFVLFHNVCQHNYRFNLFNLSLRSDIFEKGSCLSEGR